MRFIPSLALICVHLCLYAQQQPTLFTHDELIKTNNKQIVHLDLPTKGAFSTSHLPQQVIKVRKNAKQLPLAKHVYQRGGQHLKYLAHNDNSKKKAVELIVRTEPLGKQFYALLEKESQTVFQPKDTVVRLYRKRNNGKSATWKPVLTAPADQFEQYIQPRVKVHPEGHITL